MDKNQEMFPVPPAGVYTHLCTPLVYLSYIMYLYFYGYMYVEGSTDSKKSRAL